jgi:hypothetical protein
MLEMSTSISGTVAGDIQHLFVRIISLGVFDLSNKIFFTRESNKAIDINTYR